jgi:hypothetical protein
VASRRGVEPAELTGFLVQLGPEALAGVWPFVERMPTAPQRRALSNAALSGGPLAVAGLIPHLAGEAEPSPSLLREAFYVLSRLPAEEVLRVAPDLLASRHAASRREAARLIGRFRESASDGMCVDLLADPDAEVRGAALDALVLHERRDLAQAMLERALAAPGFAGFPLQEKRRLFRAVARLAGDQAVDWFVACLERRESGWFAGGPARELREAAAHGIRAVGTEVAHARLSELSRSRDRLVRTACLKELAQEQP